MSVAIPSLRGAIAVPGWAKNELWRKARAVPSLDLRFADSKSLVDATTGQSLITFTRASSGTFVNSAGQIETAASGVPRFDHNPTTGESLGLLVEEQRTNLLLQSESFNTTWSTAGSASIAANQILAPDGLLTADLLTTPSGGPNRVIQAGISVVSTTYSSSMYVKSGNINGVTFRFFFSGGTTVDTYADFIFASNSFTNINGIGTFTSQNAGGGWFRITCTVSSGNNTAWEVRVGGLITTAQTGTTAYLWGAQLEAGAFSTSYIKTEAAAATRSADVASDTTRGGNIRSLFAQFRSPASGTRPVVSLDDNTANGRIEILTSGTDPKLLVTDGGSAVADLNGGTVVANVTARAAARFSADDYAISINGGTSQLDTSGTLPTVNRVRIGSNQAGGYLGGPIARITGWDIALPMLPPISG